MSEPNKIIVLTSSLLMERHKAIVNVINKSCFENLEVIIRYHPQASSSTRQVY